MSRILVIDDDVGTLVCYKAVLRLAGHEVATAALGEDGVAIACRDPFDVVLCDLRLPDLSGMDVIRQIHQNCPCSCIVLVTAWATHDITLEAERVGAVSYVEKPIIGDALLTVVLQAQRLRRPAAFSSSATVDHTPKGWPRPSASDAIQPYAFIRLAQKAVQFSQTSRDAPTLRGLGRAVGVSAGALRNWCRTARISPRSYREFTRALRAVRLYERDQSVYVENLVDIVDRRTLQRFLKASGGHAGTLPTSVDAFLAQQQFLLHREMIAAVRSQIGSHES